MTPPDRSMGDFAFGCFKLAKLRQKSPVEVAKELAACIVTEQTDILNVEAAGPYVNITLRSGRWSIAWFVTWKSAKVWYRRFCRRTDAFRVRKPEYAQGDPLSHTCATLCLALPCRGCCRRLGIRCIR